MPNLSDAVLFLEDDDATGNDFAVEFDRNLQSLLQQPGAETIR
jgi:muramoyltetrapeptide carboxypeptidase LdcA involved in peptidoglycan recycling